MSNALLGLVLAVAGWPIAPLSTANAIGWSLLAGGCCWASTGAGIALLAWAQSHDLEGWFWRVVATVTNMGWTWALTVCLPLALLLLPDGRLPGRRWRWVLPLLAFQWAFHLLPSACSPTSAWRLVSPGYLFWPEVNALSWPMAVLGDGGPELVRAGPGSACGALLPREASRYVVSSPVGAARPAASSW